MPLSAVTKNYLFKKKQQILGQDLFRALLSILPIQRSILRCYNHRSVFSDFV